MKQSASRTQIVATIGPASSHPEVLKMMIESEMDVARLNFSWADLETRRDQIALIRRLAKDRARRVAILIDLPGPRIQNGAGHTNDESAPSSITPRDEEFIKFAAWQGVEYLALSFVGQADDVEKGRQLIASHNGTQKIVAKIERQIALDNLDEIIASADAIMIARGDLGSAILLERLPFVQSDIIKKCRAAGKPVIVATQMLFSMVNNPTPTRAEVTDVANAILQGADAIMLSEESAEGKYPVEAVKMMERISLEAERHLTDKTHNSL